MLLKQIMGDKAEIRNLGDVKWLAIEDGSAGKGTGRHIAQFILRPQSDFPMRLRRRLRIALNNG